MRLLAIQFSSDDMLYCCTAGCWLKRCCYFFGTEGHEIQSNSCGGLHFLPAIGGRLPGHFTKRLRSEQQALYSMHAEESLGSVGISLLRSHINIRSDDVAKYFVLSRVLHSLYFLSDGLDSLFTYPSRT